MPVDHTSTDAHLPADSAGVESFEQAYQDLQRLVERLDEGGLGLEEAVRLFEQGMALAATCESILEHAQLRVTRLVPDDLAASVETVPDELA